MPINDPIKGGKVAPASLAFEYGKATRRNSATSYQSIIREAESVTPVRTPVSDAKALEMDMAQNRGIVNAERRAKSHASEFGLCTQWDIIVDLVVTTGTWDPVGFQSEVISCPGSQLSGTASTNNARWFHRATKHQAGKWFYTAHLELVLTNAMQVTTARLGFFINGVIWRVVDAMDVQMSNDDATYINDVVLSGSCHVPLAKGDEFDVRVLLESTGSGDQTLGAPTSVYGYVSGHRVSCDTDSNAPPTSGASFTFT